MARPERLEGRDGQIWTAYVSGVTQEAIAAEHGISRQRIGQILDEVRQTVPEDARTDAALLAQERTNALLAAVWPAAMDGDPRAVGAALRVLERQARAMGTDAVEPLRVTLDRRLDLEGAVIGEALGAALDAVELTQEQRIAALTAAQAKLLGEEPPPPVPVPVAVVEGPDLMEDFRRFAEREGFDPDDLDDGQEDDGDGDIE